MAENTYPHPVRIAVIGGTGIQSLPGFTLIATLTPTTPWGAPSSPIAILQPPSSSSSSSSSSSATAPAPIAFLARHGTHHELAPHEVPSRANIAALRALGVRSIVAFSAVGSLQEHIRPRDFVLPDDVVDRTKGVRPWTFFERGVVAHVGFARAFDDGLRRVVRGCAHALQGEGVRLHGEGTLVCMEGPQFSSKAESNLYRSWGGAVINMSAIPESKLAREAEIAYVMICMATDYDCWREETEDVNVSMVMQTMSANAVNAKNLIGVVLEELSKEENVELVSAKHLQGGSKIGFSTHKEGWNKETVEKLKYLFPASYFE